MLKKHQAELPAPNRPNQTTSQGVGNPNCGPFVSGPLHVGMLQTGGCKRGRVCAAILERSYVAGTLHIRPLLGFPPPLQGSTVSALIFWSSSFWESDRSKTVADIGMLDPSSVNADVKGESKVLCCLCKRSNNCEHSWWEHHFKLATVACPCCSSLK
jgi:hypothetical protein